MKWPTTKHPDWSNFEQTQTLFFRIEFVQTCLLGQTPFESEQTNLNEFRRTFVLGKMESHDTKIKRNAHKITLFSFS